MAKITKEQYEFALALQGIQEAVKAASWPQ